MATIVAAGGACQARLKGKMYKIPIFQYSLFPCIMGSIITEFITKHRVKKRYTMDNQNISTPGEQNSTAGQGSNNPQPVSTQYIVRESGRRRPSLCLVIVLCTLLVFIVLPILIPSSKGTCVAILPLRDSIFNVQRELELLKDYAEDKDVKAVVVEINSPGGAVAASQELYQAILKFRKQTGKPVVASMGNVAASGGYYIACAAQEVYTNPGTVTGSIGVIMWVPNWGELVRKIGIKMEVVKSGKFKDLGSPTREMTEEERELISSVINDVYEQFFEVVLENRGKSIRAAMASEKKQQADSVLSIPAPGEQLTPESAGEKVNNKNVEIMESPSGEVSMDEVKEQLRELADGRIFSGRQAFERGLVDKVGTLADAVERAAELAGMPADTKVWRPRGKFSLWGLLTSKAPALPDIPVGDSPLLEYRFIGY
jgi:protease-4